MKIVLFAPTLRPGASGVGDYALALAGELEKLGVATALVGLCEEDLNKMERTDRHLALPAALPWPERWAAARDFCRSFTPDWASLQFVSYAFDRRGLVGDLSARLRETAPDAGWHVLFHEVWIGAKRGASWKDRLLGLAQRASIRRMAEKLRPRLAHTSNATYSELLRRAGIAAPVLPLFGNIPVAPPEPALDATVAGLLSAHGLVPGDPSAFTAGFFGALHPVWPPEPLFSRLAEAHRDRRIVLLSLGRLGPGEGLWNELRARYGDRFAFAALGEQSPAVISRILQSLDCGLATTPWQVIGKSGSAAAMLEHGLPVVVNRTEPYGLPSDAAPAPDPFLLALGDGPFPALPARRAPVSRLPEVARRMIDSLRASGLETGGDSGQSRG